MARLILTAAITLMVAACDRFPGLPPTETGLLKYDWVPADQRPAPAPLYCYATLATPECFAKPIPGRPLLGHYGATPKEPAPLAAAKDDAAVSAAPVKTAPADDRVEAAPVTPVERTPLAPASVPAAPAS